MRIWWVVSHAIRPSLRLALLKPAALSVSISTPPSRSPIITVVAVELYFVSCFCDLVYKLLIAWQCSAVACWCTLCRGMPRFSRGGMVY